MGRRRTLSFRRHPSTAPHPPSFLSKSAILSRVSDLCSQHLNFYRVHLLVFTFVPLILSAILYASNGETKNPYIDCLFMVVSAYTVTGLNTLLFASLTTWQQVIIFFCMCVGSISFVSIMTIVIRLVGAEEARIDGREYTPFAMPPSAGMQTQSRTMVERTNSAAPHQSSESTPMREKGGDDKPEKPKKKKKKSEKLRTDMIKRVDEPVRVNQMNASGWLSDRNAVEQEHANAAPPVFTEEPESTTDESGAATPAPSEHAEATSADPAPHRMGIVIDDSSKPDRSDMRRTRRASDTQALDVRHFKDNFSRTRTIEPFTQHLGGIVESPTNLSASGEAPTDSPITRQFTRTRTIDFRENDQELRLRRARTINADPDYPGRRPSHLTLRDPNNRTLTRTSTYRPDDAIVSGFGGFPNPIVAAAQFARSRIPVLSTATTMPRTTTLQSTHSNAHMTIDGRAKPVSYISFDAVVGRNSKFHNLTEAQQEELGGVEYRALKVLLKIVVGYWALVQLLSVLIISPWLTYSGTYEPVFDAQPVNPTWYSFFQVFSAFSNTGMSLLDSSMIPFQRGYLLIIVVSYLILAGNTAFPIFLRLCIWILSKVVPRNSQTRETLQFLLDHPRRCFIYLFPQTWFLVFVLVILNSIDWVAFLVLDIGNPVIDAIPVGTRIIDGLMQSFAVRAAGFTIVSLSTTAPALQMLYVVMMYVAVYPIAMSVRSSNVYEEKSLGVYDDDDESAMEAEFNQNHSATKYISYHARKQLAFDMWWLVLGLWLLCIIERGPINDRSKPEITIFSLMFEVSSAYGTVGLSLGNNSNNTSLSGVLRTLSKLVLIAIMIRGRHRGLPIAIDRAVLLPSELTKLEDDATLTRLARRNSRYTFDAGAGASEDPTANWRNMSAGGLEAVEPETDAARAARVRQASLDGNVTGFSAGLPASPPRHHANLPRSSLDSHSAQPDATNNDPPKTMYSKPALESVEHQHNVADDSQESTSSKDNMTSSTTGR
ncbi:hypothetical protein OIV83_000824 [Microbotryomycetes sp. JL201]|nr:hypothetical protein OIV83_000824 [Microbotryomycetes sp. JL201]